MAEKKKNNSSIVKNRGVDSMKNTFDGKIKYLSLDQLVDFKNHPFKVEMNTELFELMQSTEKEELKRAMAVRVPKNVILSYFYPETSVAKMMEIHRQYE